MRNSGLSAKFDLLIAQAKDDPKKIGHLFRQLSGLFYQGMVRKAPAQRTMLHDILVDLLPKVDLRVRRELAGQLYSMPSPPPELINLLVHDVIEVSGPLLEHATVPEETLLEVIKNGSIDHLNWIAKRKELSDNVRKALKKALRKAEATVGDNGKPEHPKNAPAGHEQNLKAEEIAKAPKRAESADDHQAQAQSATIRHTGSQKNSADKSKVTKQTIDRSERVDPKRFQDITRSSTDWTWETGRAGDINSLSDSAYIAFGRPAQTMRGFYLGDYCLACDPDLPYQDLQDILDLRRPFRSIDIMTTDRLGRDRYWQVSGVPRFDLGTGRFLGFRGTATEADLMAPAHNNHAPDSNLERSALAEPVSDFGSGPEQPRGDHQNTLDVYNDVKTTPNRQIADYPGMYSASADNTDTTMLGTSVPGTQENAQSEAEKRAAETVQNLSHEFRTPLNAILGFSEMIDHETLGPVNDQYHEQTRKILHSAHHLKNVITDVLDAAKLKAGKQAVRPRFISLKSVVKTCVSDVRKHAAVRKIELAEFQSDQDITLLNDGEAIQRCLVKVLVTAIDWAKGDQPLSIRMAVDNHLRQAILSIPLFGRSPEPEANWPPGTKACQGSYALLVASQIAQTIGAKLEILSGTGRSSHVRLTIVDFPDN